MRQETIQVKVRQPRPARVYHVPVMFCETLTDVQDRYTSEEIVKAVNYVNVLQVRSRVRKQHFKDLVEETARRV